MQWALLPLLLVLGTVIAFECDSDTILRLATNHRGKDVEEECHRGKTGIKCEEQANVDKLWKEYEDLQRQYKTLVNDCVKQRREGTQSRVRRSDDDHDAHDPNIDHTGHNHRRRRHQDHDPNDPDIDHTGHNHKKRRHIHRRQAIRVPEDHGLPQDDIQNNIPLKPQVVATRSRRQVCKNKASDDLAKLHNEFKEFCDRENICLPDEDLPEGSKRDHFKEIQNQRAKKYTTYLLEVASCNAT